MVNDLDGVANVSAPVVTILKIVDLPFANGRDSPVWRRVDNLPLSPCAVVHLVIFWAQADRIDRANGGMANE